MAHTQLQIAKVLGAIQQINAGGDDSSGLKPQLPTFIVNVALTMCISFGVHMYIKKTCMLVHTHTCWSPMSADVLQLHAAAQLRGPASEWWYSLYDEVIWDSTSKYRIFMITSTAWITLPINCVSGYTLRSTVTAKAPKITKQEYINTTHFRQTHLQYAQ